MNIRCGPYRIIALHCGKFDFAELEIDAPVHLIGPNNVGKTSLIALLQFLYLDDQRQMQFAREMSDTRRYYFPEKYSYALFECLTPTGFQVVGVHGLGPVRQYNFERFVCTGRIDIEDFLDETRRVREPEDTFARLALKDFKRLEPRHLRAALTGVGDARDVFLGLVPARHGSTYERFRKVFGNILRLAHIRQEELKQLLLDIFSNEFQQREIDLARHYAAGFEQVKRDAHEVRELKLLQADIERLLRHLDRRDAARQGIPALWEAIGKAYTEQTASLEHRDALLLASREQIAAEQAELKTRIEAAHAARRDLAGQNAVLGGRIERIEEQRKRFEGFVPDWVVQRQATVRARQEELVYKLRGAAEESSDRLRRRLDRAEKALAVRREQFGNLEQAAVNRLRRQLDDREIADAFSVLNPAILALPVNTARPGLRIPDDETAPALVRELLALRKDRTLQVRGIALDLDALEALRLGEYLDPERIREDIAALEKDVRSHSETLETVRQAEPLRQEKAALDAEQSSLIRDLAAYEQFCAEETREPEWRDERESLREREQVLDEQIAEQERRRTDLVEADQAQRSERAEIERRRLWLQEQTRALPPPADTWPPHPLEDLPQDWNDLLARYRKLHAEEQSQAEQAREILDTIESRTYGRYTAEDENATIQALRNQLESIPQREKAVAEMWKGIAVGIKKDLRNIARDLDTLKSLANGLNRQLAAVTISNLASLKLLIEERPQWVTLIREVSVDDELPLFSNPQATDDALEGIGRLLADHPRVDLKDLFNLSFEVGTPDGKTYRHEHLDAIESNGTTVAIKVLVNLVLLRGLLGRAEVQIPFYLDECSSLDQANLAAIVGAARRMGFIAVLASPDPMDAADKLYFLEEQENGRVVLDPRTAMVRIQRPDPESEAPENA